MRRRLGAILTLVSAVTVAADGSWSTEAPFRSLEQFEGGAAGLTFRSEGRYPFFRTFHGNAEGDGMAGTLTVVPARDHP